MLRRESREPGNKPTYYLQLICDKGRKDIQWKKTTSSISGARKIGWLHVKEIKLKDFLLL